MDAAVEGRGVDALDWWRDGEEMGGEFFGLGDAVAGQLRVAGYSCGGGDGG